MYTINNILTLSVNETIQDAALQFKLHGMYPTDYDRLKSRRWKRAALSFLYRLDPSYRYNASRWAKVKYYMGRAMYRYQEYCTEHPRIPLYSGPITPGGYNG